MEIMYRFSKQRHNVSAVSATLQSDSVDIDVTLKATLMVSIEQYAQRKADLLRYLKKSERLEVMPGQLSSDNVDDEFSVWLKNIKRDGWSRRDVYNLLWDVFKNHDNELTESSLDQLGEFETGITGFCHENCIEYFPSDPVDKNDLAKYVRSGAWR